MQTEEQTIIYYSKKKTVSGMRVAAIFFVAAVLLPIIFSSEVWAYFFGIFIMIFSAMVGLNIYKYYANKQPQIIISAGGIQTSKIPFLPWKDITGEDVVQISEGRTTGWYLVYDHPYGHAKHSLSFLDTDDGTLSEILKMYRGKSQDEGIRSSGNPMVS